MKKELLLSAILLAGAFSLKAQMLSPEVVASAGDYYANSAGQLSWTAGESMVETFTAGSNILTQGFQQPVNVFTTTVHHANTWAEIKAYPNPTYNVINLCFPKATQGLVNAEISDVTGKVVYAEAINPKDGLVKIDLSAFENGMYLLELSNSSGQDQTILRIQKTN